MDDKWRRASEAMGAGEFDLLRNNRVGVVGVGTLGRAIIHNLAGYGIGLNYGGTDGVLRIFDPDQIGEENLVRWEAVLSDVGKNKADYTAERIMGRDIRFNVESYAEDVWKVPEYVEGLDLLVIAGLGNEFAMAEVARLARDSGIAAMATFVRPGGEGGEIFRQEPSREEGPCYTCYSIARRGARTEMQASGQRRVVYGVNVENTGGIVPGLSAHVNMVAGVATDCAVNILLDRPMDYGDPNYIIYATKPMVLYQGTKEEEELPKWSAAGFKILKSLECPYCVELPKIKIPRHLLK